MSREFTRKELYDFVWSQPIEVVASDEGGMREHHPHHASPGAIIPFNDLPETRVSSRENNPGTSQQALLATRDLSHAQIRWDSKMVSQKALCVDDLTIPGSNAADAVHPKCSGLARLAWLVKTEQIQAPICMPQRSNYAYAARRSDTALIAIIQNDLDRRAVLPDRMKAG